jgi:hypothetical protein
MVIFGDYWDKETITQVINLLKEYEDVFPRRFSKMKGIVGSLGDTNSSQSRHQITQEEALPIKPKI